MMMNSFMDSSSPYSHLSAFGLKMSPNHDATQQHLAPFGLKMSPNHDSGSIAQQHSHLANYGLKMSPNLSDARSNPLVNDPMLHGGNTLAEMTSAHNSYQSAQAGNAGYPTSHYIPPPTHMGQINQISSYTAKDFLFKRGKRLHVIRLIDSTTIESIKRCFALPSRLDPRQLKSSSGHRLNSASSSIRPGESSLPPASDAHGNHARLLAPLSPIQLSVGASSQSRQLAG